MDIDKDNAFWGPCDMPHIELLADRNIIDMMYAAW